MENETRPTNTFVATIDKGDIPKLKHDLDEQGFTLTTPPHTHFSAKKTGISCTVYTSGKLTVQGKGMQEFIEFYLEPEILKTFSHTHKHSLSDKSSRIGIDESGKGDFFGPLCVAGVYGTTETIAKLEKIGVKDSKKLTDPTIEKMAAKIKDACAYHIVKINPSRYNELIGQFGNLNHLLAWGHATTIEHLYEKTGCEKVIIDQFANEKVVLTALKRKKLDLDLTQRHRAEEDVVVAAASILARAAFVQAIRALEEEFQQEFPKGASGKTIAAGKRFVRTYGKEALIKVGKVHFKTIDSILG